MSRELFWVIEKEIIFYIVSSQIHTTYIHTDSKVLVQPISEIQQFEYSFINGETTTYPICIVSLVSSPDPNARSPSSIMLKYLLPNRTAKFYVGNKILFAVSGSHDQDGGHIHIL